MTASINIVMPMGGEGSRFLDKGIGVPKPLIILNGKPFFYWAIQSLYKFVKCSKLICVVLKQHVDNFQINKKISSYYPEVQFVYLDKVLKGAVLTCQKGVEIIDNHLPVIFNDCDHLFYAPELYNHCNTSPNLEVDGILLSFRSSDPKFSYLDYDKNGFVNKTVEKKVISNDAICGAYFFKDRETFTAAADDCLKTEISGEYYMSGVYNSLIAKGGKVKGISAAEHLSFGTPEEFIEAEKSPFFNILQ